jgi:hypothetical protein
MGRTAPWQRVVVTDASEFMGPDIVALLIYSLFDSDSATYFYDAMVYLSRSS